MMMLNADLICRKVTKADVGTGVGSDTKANTNTNTNTNTNIRGLKLSI